MLNTDLVAASGATLAPPPEHPTLRRMVEALKELRGRSGGVTEQDLRDRDFTDADIVEFGNAAAIIARREMLRREQSHRPDRQQRLARARAVLFAQCPTRQIAVAALQGDGFTKHEIDDLLEDAITLAADDFGDQAVQQ